ncbi:DUF2628 domain-containing protein [Alkalicoccus daliensis]|uniref:DUF2628 domain-containing protein n=1 Tax=Alkalicoccus daliensis TaxID=745820 RepID=A0A1H0IMY4_9BACI|nr:DUF2628 domain-containing protein [Alkalicoccus daliensis]SDO32809.1 Protein of unknown function [Alkalicoccus daliensis]
MDNFPHTLVGQNSNYYYNAASYKNPFRFSGWNWAAFLLAPFWAASRHMYILSAAYFGTVLLFLLIESFLPALLNLTADAEPSLFLLVFPMLLLHSFFGLAGNPLYLRKIRRQLQMQESGKSTAPLFRASGRSTAAGVLVTALLAALTAYPFVLAEEWMYNPPLENGIYVYNDEAQTPAGQINVAEEPVFQKYDARINLLYVGESLENRTLAFELFFLNNGIWESINDRSFTFFSQDRLSLGLLDAEDPAVRTGEYRVDLFIDTQLYDSQTFYVAAPGS